MLGLVSAAKLAGTQAARAVTKRQSLHIRVFVVLIDKLRVYTFVGLMFG